MNALHGMEWMSSSNVTKVYVIINSIKHLWCFLDSPKNLTCLCGCEGLNKSVELNM